MGFYLIFFSKLFNFAFKKTYFPYYSMRVTIDSKVTKNLNRMPVYVSEKVYAAAELLEQYPMIRADLKKLGEGIYRMRIGSYRLIFKVYKEQDLIVIAEVETRGGVSYSKG